MRNSPFVEKLTAADYEVIYFTDPLDEYVMSNMPDFDDHKFQDVTKDDLKIGKDKAEKKREKKVKVGPGPRLMATTKLTSRWDTLCRLLSIHLICVHCSPVVGLPVRMPGTAHDAGVRVIL